MLSNATVVIKLEEYPKGFALVIVASPTDHLCQVRRKIERNAGSCCCHFRCKRR